MDQKLVGKTALITGASSGQGAAEARLFARHGAQVVACDIQDAAGEALVRSIRDGGGTAHYRRLDVSREAEWWDTVAFVRSTFGGLHVLVNNAGIPLRGVDFIHTKREDWDRVLAVNLTGPFLGMQAAAPLMRDSGGGAIVNTGSTAGLSGHFAAAYSASKWGLRGLSKSAAMEFAAWNIRVNAIHPGIVETPMVSGAPDFMQTMEEMTVFKRSASCEEVAAIALFLVSEESRYLTGLDIPVDAGFTDLGIYHQVITRVRARAKSAG